MRISFIVEIGVSRLIMKIVHAPVITHGQVVRVAPVQPLLGLFAAPTWDEEPINDSYEVVVYNSLIVDKSSESSPYSSSIQIWLTPFSAISGIGGDGLVMWIRGTDDTRSSSPGSADMGCSISPRGTSQIAFTAIANDISRSHPRGGQLSCTLSFEKSTYTTLTRHHIPHSRNVSSLHAPTESQLRDSLPTVVIPPVPHSPHHLVLRHCVS